MSNMSELDVHLIRVSDLQPGQLTMVQPDYFEEETRLKNFIRTEIRWYYVAAEEGDYNSDKFWENVSTPNSQVIIKDRDALKRVILERIKYNRYPQAHYDRNLLPDHDNVVPGVVANFEEWKPDWALGLKVGYFLNVLIGDKMHCRFIGESLARTTAYENGIYQILA